MSPLIQLLRIVLCLGMYLRKEKGRRFALLFCIEISEAIRSSQFMVVLNKFFSPVRIVIQSPGLHAPSCCNTNSVVSALTGLLLEAGAILTLALAEPSRMLASEPDKISPTGQGRLGNGMEYPNVLQREQQIAFLDFSDDLSLPVTIPSQPFVPSVGPVIFND